MSHGRRISQATTLSSTTHTSIAIDMTTNKQVQDASYLTQLESFVAAVMLSASHLWLARPSLRQTVEE